MTVSKTNRDLGLLSRQVTLHSVQRIAEDNLRKILKVLCDGPT